MFCQFEDDENFEEYYDLDSDPWQLNNLALSLGEELTEERNMLADLAKCKGKECQKYNSETSTTTSTNHPSVALRPINNTELLSFILILLFLSNFNI